VSLFTAFSVHIKIEENISLTAGKDGGLQNMEIHGTAVLHIQDEAFAHIKIHFENADTRGIQMQVCYCNFNIFILFAGKLYLSLSGYNLVLKTHPNVDKELYRSKHQVGLKNPQKPFPANTDVPILKWRYQTNDEMQIPLTSKIKMFPQPVVKF